MRYNEDQVANIKFPLLDLEKIRKTLNENILSFVKEAETDAASSVENMEGFSIISQPEAFPTRKPDTFSIICKIYFIKVNKYKINDYIYLLDKFDGGDKVSKFLDLINGKTVENYTSVNAAYIDNAILDRIDDIENSKLCWHFLDPVEVKMF